MLLADTLLMDASCADFYNCYLKETDGSVCVTRLRL